MMMAIKDIACSSGSAFCTSASLEPSYVLSALGVDVELAHTSIRFGVGRFNTEAEIDFALQLIIDKVKGLREMFPSTKWSKRESISNPFSGLPTKSITSLQNGGQSWHTVTNSSTTSRIPRTPAHSTRATTMWVPVWSVHLPVAMS